jgi:8-oxo-dGTP diphosphatase
MKKYVLGFAFNSSKDWVVLILKERPAWQKGLFNGVGGHIEKDEEPHEAMSREFWEETGIETEATEWRLVGLMEGDDWDCVLYTIAEDSMMSASTKTDEAIGVFEVNDVLRGDYATISNVPFLIELCRDPHGPKFTRIKY